MTSISSSSPKSSWVSELICDCAEIEKDKAMAVIKIISKYFFIFKGYQERFVYKLFAKIKNIFAYDSELRSRINKLYDSEVKKIRGKEKFLIRKM